MFETTLFSQLRLFLLGLGSYESEKMKQESGITYFSMYYVVCEQ